MNRWLITGLIVIVVLVLLGVAYDQGLLDNIGGATMAMIFAALAAPYMAVKNWLTGNRLQKEFKEKYEVMSNQEKAHRTDYDQEIALKQKRIADMDKEIQLLDAKLEVLDLKKKKVEQDVKSMTIEDKKREVQNLFGD